MAKLMVAIILIYRVILKKYLKLRLKSFEIVTTFRYKGRIMKLFNVGKVMTLVSVSIHEARIPRSFFVDLKASRR